MKSLDQIEPRTPISSAPFTITQPGSYYLTTNLVVSRGNAITIATNGVTLALSGFTIASAAPSAGGYAILINGRLHNLRLRDGFIDGGVTNSSNGVYSGPGFAYGIAYLGAQPLNVLVSQVSVAGCLDDGINLGNLDSALVESCTVRTVGGYGIVASTVRGCVAVNCGYTAIWGDQVSDCRGESLLSDGIDAISSAINCHGVSDGGGYGLYGQNAENGYGSSASGYYGIFAQSSVLNCYGSASGYEGYGIQAYTVLNSYGYGTGTYGAGIWARTMENSYGISSSYYGAYAAEIATGCYGSSNSGTGLYAFIANVCHGESGTGTPISYTHGVNSF